MVKDLKKSLEKNPIVQNKAQKLQKYCMKPEQHILQKNLDCRKNKAVQFKLDTWIFLFCFQGVWSNYSQYLLFPGVAVLWAISFQTNNWNSQDHSAVWWYHGQWEESCYTW